LFFENLFLLKISSFSTLLELVPVFLIPVLEMLQSIGECLELLLTLSDLAIELITVSLELLFLLSCFDDIVSLGVLLHISSFSILSGVLLNKSFVLDLKVLHLVLSLLEFNCNLMSLFFSCFLLTHKNILVNSDLFLSLFHTHL